MPANSSQPCPGQPCHTISEYAAEVNDLSSDSTLIFLEGEHILNRNFSVQDIDQLSFTVASLGGEAVVSCQHDGDNFVIGNVQNISISGLVFLGCYGNMFVNASNLNIMDSLFKGLLNGSQAALHVSDIESVNIFNCSLVDYEVRAYDGLLGCALLYLNNASYVNILHSWQLCGV